MSFSRRKFIRSALGVTTLASFAPATPEFLLRSAWAASVKPAKEQTALVVIQLSGGNDGLNTVVPYGDDAYARSRPTLRFKPEELLKLDGLIGFHPQMSGFNALYQEGLLCVAHGVGCPNPSQDHVHAMRAWHTAAEQPLGPATGWVGRAADAVWDPLHANVPALFVGRIDTPLGLNAAKTLIPQIRSVNDLCLGAPPVPPPPEAAGRPVLPWQQLLAELPQRKADNPWLESLRQGLAQAAGASRRILSVAEAKDTHRYPDTDLAADLRTIAQLIRAELGIRIFFAELGGGGIGGFDNHANQKGNHCALLHQLSEAVLAFIRDLQRDHLLDRVWLMTFSEFGRTLKENGRRGTDHGSAAPVFLAGGKLKGRQFGRHPSLTELENGGLKVATDFRRLYATVLDRWLGIESRAVLHREFATLDLLRG